MKKFLALFFLSLVLLSSCKEEDVTPDCDAPVFATVRDLTGLDGCGFVFELNDGTRLEPLRVFFCGTPPLPKEMTEDPLLNFEFVDGKTVKIGYEICEDCNSICMVGQIVKIKCITEVSAPTSDL